MAGGIAGWREWEREADSSESAISWPSERRWVVEAEAGGERRRGGSLRRRFGELHLALEGWEDDSGPPIGDSEREAWPSVAGPARRRRRKWAGSSLGKKEGEKERKKKRISQGLK